MVHGGETCPLSRVSEQVAIKVESVDIRTRPGPPRIKARVHDDTYFDTYCCRYGPRLNLLGKLQTMPLEKLCLSPLRLGSFFSQSRRPPQLALSNLLDVHLI